MKRALTAIAITLASFSIAATAGAQPSSQASAQAGGRCVAGQEPCRTVKAEPGKASEPAKAKQKAMPRVGESGKSGAVFQRARNSRVAAPPSGQEYRVVKNHLVLVQSGNGRIARVVGPISDYAK